MKLNFMSAGSRPACRDGQDRAPPRQRTLSARLARQQPHRAVAVGLASLITDKHVLAGGCSRVNECRSSAEARLHTEHGSGLLNDHANWLRPAPPEPRAEKTEIPFFGRKNVKLLCGKPLCIRWPQLFSGGYTPCWASSFRKLYMSECPNQSCVETC